MFSFYCFFITLTMLLTHSVSPVCMTTAPAFFIRSKSSLIYSLRANCTFHQGNIQEQKRLHRIFSKIPFLGRLSWLLMARRNLHWDDLMILKIPLHALFQLASFLCKYWHWIQIRWCWNLDNMKLYLVCFSLILKWQGSYSFFGDGIVGLDLYLLWFLDVVNL